MRALWIIVCAGLASSCVQLSFQRRLFLTPPDRVALAELEPGASDLSACLERLGAPLYVWELPADGVALAYGALRTRAREISVSLPVTNDASASFTYDDIDSRLKGAVLCFDAERRLTLLRKGLLRDLRLETERRRPSTPEPRAPAGAAR